MSNSYSPFMPRLSPSIEISETGLTELWLKYTMEFKEVPTTLVAPLEAEQVLKEMREFGRHIRVDHVCWGRADYLLVGAHGVAWSGPL